MKPPENKRAALWEMLFAFEIALFEELRQFRSDMGASVMGMIDESRPSGTFEDRNANLLAGMIEGYRAYRFNAGIKEAAKELNSISKGLGDNHSIGAFRKQIKELHQQMKGLPD